MKLMLKPNAGRLAWIAAASCVACCATVPLLVALGVTGVAGLAIYLDYAAIGFLVAAVFLFGYKILVSKVSSCKRNCSCEGKAETV